MKKILFIVLTLLILTSSLIYAAPLNELEPIEPGPIEEFAPGPMENPPPQAVDEPIDSTDEEAVVLEAGEAESRQDLYEDIRVQDVKIEIKTGKYKGQVREIENHLSENDAYNILVEKGDKVIVLIEEYGDRYEVFIADYLRSDYIIYLAVLGIALVLLVGRFKGLKSLISLGLTIGAVVYILLPQILKGADPVALSIIISIVITIVTIFMVSGVNNKGLAAILGTVSGVMIAGIISYISGNLAHLTGLSAQEATMLIYIPQAIEFNFRKLLFAGIILGSLGAVMDVGMSIASSIEEIYRANNDLSVRDLFNSGMNVGRDIMGTMINTLILAYTGTSIPMLLLFMAYETSMTKIVNLDIIATEVVRSLSGSIGLILTIPITAIIASLLIKRGTLRKEKGVDIND